MSIIGCEKMEFGRSKEELVIEERLTFSKGQSRTKWLIAIAVVLTVMTILFIGLYATERKKLKDAEKENAAAKGSPPTQALPTKAPSTKAPSTKAPSTKAPSTKAPPTKAPSTKAPFTTPGTDLSPDSVQVAASK